MIRWDRLTVLVVLTWSSAADLKAQVPGVVGGQVAYMDSGMVGGSSEQMYPFDNPAPWLHGQFQAIPAYGGHVSFRPYNFKHVGPQARMATMMGAPSTMPYSQQFWHRYEESARMERVSADPARNPLATRLTQVIDRRVLPASAQWSPQTRVSGGGHWPREVGVSTATMDRLASTPLEQPIASSARMREAEIQQLRRQIQNLQNQLRATQLEPQEGRGPLLRITAP